MPTITLSDAALVQCVDAWRVSGWKLTMRFIVLAVAVSALAVADDQAQKLIDTIVALQAPLEDFRCEFEGTVHVASQTAPGSDVAARERHDCVQRHVPLEKRRRFLVRQLPRRRPGPSENRAPDHGRA